MGALKDGKDWDLNLYTMSYLVSPPGAALAVIACPRSNDPMGFRKAMQGYDGPGYGYGNQSYGYGTTEDNYGYGGPTNGYGEQSSGYGYGYGRPSCDQGQMWLEILEVTLGHLLFHTDISPPFPGTGGAAQVSRWSKVKTLY